MSDSTGPRPVHALQNPAKLANVDKIQADLQKAIDKAFCPHPTKYKEVTVLMLHFTNDDLGIVKLEDELARVLKDDFDYRVRQRFLRATAGLTPAEFLSKELLEIKANGWLGPNCLLIIVFSGHGELVSEGNGMRKHDVFHVGGAIDPSGRLKDRTLRWSSAMDLLRYSDADLVQFIDCCFAAEAAVPWMETLAATSGTELASSNLDTCFTKALTSSLSKFGSMYRKALTVSHLQKFMMDRREDFKLTYTPFYDPRLGNKPSVVLTPKKTNLPSTIVLDTPNPSPRVVLTVHTESTLRAKDIEDFKVWLTTLVPQSVTNMEIELDAWYNADSTVLEINLPFEVWQQIPEGEGWQFSKMVRSKNLLLQNTAP